MITVDANLFRIVSKVQSTEETRYYLNGVHIEPHPEQGAILVATDGHRMIVAHDPLGRADEIGIVKLPRYASQLCGGKLGIIRTKAATHRLLHVDAKARSATIEDRAEAPDGTLLEQASLVTAFDVVIDGSFPDWRRAVPKEVGKPESSRPTAFNPLHLKLWGEIGNDIVKHYKTGQSALRIALSDGASPVVVRWAPETIFGIQMPMRDNFKGPAIPAFVAVPMKVAGE